MKNKLIITGSLYKKLIKIITTIKIRATALIINNLFLQFLSSSLHNLARINPVGKPSNSKIK